ncbi:hypothetical protein OG887_17535 [Streptomyces sp. NBC_00053]|uniref:hypothetical protein n=1 Tax=unclassified Streptomyces TaxID=2593676 RepID=UPI000FAC18B0|nr:MULTISPECIES: hypothetical protein [unclassified Streptomyces]WSG51452.1 hypothetical protein OHA38_17540 [Streptomyces sp. NBC_01732]WSX02109.1 hypothetical protein OG355_17670 [Streptomyces sp. NBC_00987]MCX4395987.1 hypothetical protein [Streptomyces sp. NBC_01767]MCX5101381.1 hypothetical protein [Streptomyces sp. NBC_00439]MCX5501168.1 hypothetical protein [Streptomyces sp. NBC_00052]
MGFTSSKARAVLVVALGALCQGQLAAGAAWADAPDGGMETHHGPSLVTIDNSNADSWLEVDRTLNVLGPFSKGTAGSDHDGGGGAIDQNVSASQGVGVQAAPDESEGEDEEEEGGAAPRSAPAPESAATGGDDDEGDADNEAGGTAGDTVGAPSGTAPQAAPAPSRP